MEEEIKRGFQPKRAAPWDSKTPESPLTIGRYVPPAVQIPTAQPKAQPSPTITGPYVSPFSSPNIPAIPKEVPLANKQNKERFIFQPDSYVSSMAENQRMLDSNLIYKQTNEPTWSYFLRQQEGFTPRAKFDVKGNAVGHGSHYNLDDSDVRPGQVVSWNEAQKLMYHHVNTKVIPRLIDAFGDEKWVTNLNSNQKAALISLSYNLSKPFSKQNNKNLIAAINEPIVGKTDEEIEKSKQLYSKKLREAWMAYTAKEKPGSRNIKRREEEFNLFMKEINPNT